MANVRTSAKNVDELQSSTTIKMWCSSIFVYCLVTESCRKSRHKTVYKFVDELFNALKTVFANRVIQKLSVQHRILGNWMFTWMWTYPVNLGEYRLVGNINYRCCRMPKKSHIDMLYSSNKLCDWKWHACSAVVQRHVWRTFARTKKKLFTNTS